MRFFILLTLLTVAKFSNSQSSDSLNWHFINLDFEQKNIDSLYVNEPILFIVNAEPSCTGCKYSIENFINDKAVYKKAKIIVLKGEQRLIIQSLSESYVYTKNIWKRSNEILFYNSKDSSTNGVLWQDFVFNKNNPFIIVRDRKGNYTFLSYQCLFAGTELTASVKKQIMKLLKN